MWVRSSHSTGDGGECVECAPGHLRTHGAMLLRDSKAPEGPVVTVSGRAWRRFRRGLATEHSTWIKSSYSAGDGGQCVECAPGHLRTHGVMPVRDSKNPGGPVLAVSARAWRAFLREVCGGAVE